MVGIDCWSMFDSWYYGRWGNDYDNYYEFTASDTRGVGVGLLMKQYIIPLDYFSGLYQGYGFDFIFASVKDTDRDYNSGNVTYSNETYKAFAMAPYYNVGASFGLSKFRFNPSISFAYTYLYDEKYGGDFQILILPEVHFCFIID